MQTIKVKAWATGQGDHVLINLVDFDPSKHELADGENFMDRGGGARASTIDELHAIRDALERRERELNEQRDANHVYSVRLREQSVANEAEAQRLRDVAARMAAMPSAHDATEPASMTKDQLHAALDTKGIKYPATANKAELQALLVTAQS